MSDKTKFEKPDKPDVAELKAERVTDETAYQYKDARGEPRFFQGLDATLKSVLMTVSRDPNEDGRRRAAARKKLVSKGWSTEEVEKAHLEEAQEKLARKAEKADKKTDPKPEPVEDEPEVAEAA